MGIQRRAKKTSNTKEKPALMREPKVLMKVWGYLPRVFRSVLRFQEIVPKQTMSTPICGMFRRVINAKRQALKDLFNSLLSVTFRAVTIFMWPDLCPKGPTRERWIESSWQNIESQDRSTSARGKRREGKPTFSIFVSVDSFCCWPRKASTAFSRMRRTSRTSEKTRYVSLATALAWGADGTASRMRQSELMASSFNF